ncbi:hypothetical protein POTOM_006327 [Populus tomentosa]|uniref:Uncharacterized protein n=1 Tax=Populus tomentosa TaxID=118781 RepID=A0A8X8DEK9_POPTO|nr:hypothetical protein POTOM_006327 [Populus tomentosa]
MDGALVGKEKKKLAMVEQDLLPIEELVDASRKSTVGRKEYLLELVLILELLMAGEEGVVFLLARRSSTSVVVLLKTALLLLGKGRFDHALLMPLRGGATGDKDDGDGDAMLLVKQTFPMFLLIFTCSGHSVFLVSSVGFVTLVSYFMSLGSWPSTSPGFFLSMSMCRKELDRLVSRFVQKTIQIASFETKLLECYLLWQSGGEEGWSLLREI